MSTETEKIQNHESRIPRLSVGGLSDVGKVRAENQDAFALDQDMGLFIVSDGM